MFDPEDLSEMKEKELWAMLADAELLDEFRIRQELRSRLWQQKEFVQVTAMCDQIIRVAKLLDEDESVIADYLYTKGSAHFNAREYEEAVTAYSNSAEIYGAIGSQYQLAEALWAKADSLYSLDQDSSAADIALESSRLYESENSLSEAGRSMFLHAKALFYSDREEDALEAAIEARNLYRVNGNTVDVAYVDNFRVTILDYLNRKQECIEILRVCLFIWQTLPTDSHTLEWEAITAKRLAHFLLHTGEIHESIEYYNLAKTKFKECEKFEEIAACEFGIAQCQDELENFDEAIKSFLQARALADVNGKDELAINAEVSRAISLHRSERYEEARALNLRILNELEQSQNPENFDTAHRVRVRAADNALELKEWHNVLEILRGFSGYPNFEPVVQISVWSQSIESRALYELGKFDEAYQIVDKALLATTDDLATWVTAFLYEIRGRILFDRNDRKALQDLVHAIALHLANDKIERAKLLSENFLPTNNSSKQLFDDLKEETEKTETKTSNKPAGVHIELGVEGIVQGEGACPHCGKIFSDLAIHFTYAHRVQRCLTCGSELVGLLALENHELTAHAF